MANEFIKGAGGAWGAAATRGVQTANTAPTEKVTAELTAFTNDAPFRRESPRSAFGALPANVQKFFYGPRLLQGEAIGLGHTSEAGNKVFLYPYWGNLGSDAAHVVGVSTTPEGRHVPVKGVIESTWFGRTARLKLEPAGRSFGPDEGGSLEAALVKLRTELLANKPVPPAKDETDAAPAARPSDEPWNAGG